MSPHLANTVGWAGAVALLAGYALISFGLLDPREIPYQGLVFAGSVGLVLVSLSKRLMQTAILNAVSAVVAVLAMLAALLS